MEQPEATQLLADEVEGVADGAATGVAMRTCEEVALVAIGAEGFTISEGAEAEDATEGAEAGADATEGAEDAATGEEATAGAEGVPAAGEETAGAEGAAGEEATEGAEAADEETTAAGDETGGADGAAAALVVATGVEPGAYLRYSRKRGPPHLE